MYNPPVRALRLVRTGLLVSLLTVGACSQTPAVSDYDQQFNHPVQTNSFTLVDKVVYDNPYQGVRLRYLDRKYPDDRIEVLVYPVSEYAWRENRSLLNQEMDYVLHEVDQAVADGHYLYRSEESRQSHDALSGLEVSDISGIRSDFRLHSGDGKTLATFIYLFLQKDKFVQFRTLFDADLSPDWNGDFAVEELLPEMDVPGPSPFMTAKRKQAQQEYQRRVQHFMKQGDS